MAELRYGVLGGSFDPPHYGHLVLAETARVQLALDRVLFVPAGQPPHKPPLALSPPEDRVALVTAAIAGNAAFELARVDLDRPGPHYTVDMLARLRAQHSDVATWYFLMGEDSLHEFAQWHTPDAILAQVILAVMPRDEGPGDLDEVYVRFPVLRTRLVWLDAPRIQISATALRRRAREGLPLRYLTPPDVVAYIAQHRLYL
ncbi:MAG: nicotinate (nicotinamide) nucleotide adenylyltransferase [Anaerolineae bacterium]|nr:nicotinate (nicotinamide) nucleotide adenylyltransferase [Anaerolineae bacterium]